jgi:Flp pilus assembly protein TadD, contains TPR repeats
MILFLSVFITDERTKWSRGHYGTSYDRLNVFKYTLASYSVIKWSYVIIYYDLDVSYESRREELKGWINSLFINPIVYDYRPTHQSEWLKAMEEVFSFEDDDLVWFCCNDDHVFIDYDTDLLYRLEAKLSDLSQNYPYVACGFSHWPEYLAYSAKPSYSASPHEGIIEDTEEYCIVRNWNYNDSILIVNKNWLKYLWCEVDYGDIRLARPDWVAGVRLVPTTTIVPYRELVRHYDVYTHVNIDLNLCPPLHMPDGFFENDIKILYCAEQRKLGYVHVNPQIENYYSHDHLSGVDSRYCLEDLPLFWKNRISTIEVAQEIDRELLLKYRDNAVLKLASSKLIHYEEVNLSDFAKRIKFALRSDYYLLDLNSSNSSDATKDNQPSVALAYQEIGNRLFQEGYVEESIAYFLKSLEIHQGETTTYLNLGNAYAQINNWLEAFNCYVKAVNLNAPQPYIGIAKTLHKLGQLENAVKFWQKALALNLCETSKHLSQLANTLINLGKLDEAIRCYQILSDFVTTDFQQISQVEPSSLSITISFSELYYDLGIYLEEMGDLEKAITCYRHAFQISKRESS